jgi:acyl-CoA reductase-like NAD-dependent aldehyde dehydrogenase
LRKQINIRLVETAPAAAPKLSSENFHNVIAGSLRSSKKVHRRVNPSDKSLLWDVPIATERDLGEAVEIAREVFKTWSKTTRVYRQDVLGEMRDALATLVPQFAKLLSLGGGKPVSWFELGGE